MADLYKMTGHGGTNFHCTNKALPVKQIRILSEVEESVGLITIENERVIGTGFLVGKGHLMTAYHIFTDKIDSVLDYIAWFTPSSQFERWTQKYIPNGQKLEGANAIQKYLKEQMTLSFESFREFMDEKCYKMMSDKWCKECYVQFWKYSDKGHSSTESTFFFTPYIPFADKQNDVIILKILEDVPDSLPPSLSPVEEFEGIERVNLYGYLNHKKTRQLHMDPQSIVYVDETHLDHDIQKATTWWEKKEKRLDDSGVSKLINVTEEFSQCSSKYNQIHGCVTLHASKSFIFGTSGSPVMFLKEINKEEKPVVMGMYLRGYPDFYYKIKKSIETGQQLPSNLSHYNKFRKLVENDETIPPKCFFESAITMQHVAYVLDRIPQFKMLKREIFQKQDQEGNIGSENAHGTSSQRSLCCNTNECLHDTQLHAQESNAIYPSQSFGDNIETNNPGATEKCPPHKSLHENPKVRLRTTQQIAQGKHVIDFCERPGYKTDNNSSGNLDRVPLEHDLTNSKYVTSEGNNLPSEWNNQSDGLNDDSDINSSGNLDRVPLEHDLTNSNYVTSEGNNLPRDHLGKTFKHLPSAWNDQSERLKDDSDTALREQHSQQKKEVWKKLQKKSWFYNKISRLEAEQCVLQQTHGAFLARHSETFQGQYVLTYNDRGKAEHLKMEISDIGRIIDMLPIFKSVFDFIHYLSKHYKITKLPCQQ